jgi:REP element-mobilizing transposase RayT
MTIKRTIHEVYEIRYHPVWESKYRKLILIENVRDPLNELFAHILPARHREIEEMGGAYDRVHIFTSISPNYSTGWAARVTKSVSAK